MLSHAQPDRRAYQLEFMLQSLWPESRSGMDPSADPLNSGAIHRHDLSRSPRILSGRIIEGVAYTHFYRVQVENAMSTLPCVAMGHTSFSALGARQLNTYSPGTGVYLIYNPETWYGVIIGAEPDFMVDATHALSDFIVQGSRVGLQVDNVHKFPFALAEGGNVADWSAGRPSDSLTNGEWGAITETGLRVFLDSFMACLAADESTGVWAFYMDQLLRVAGHNLQERAYGFDKEYLDDETELHHVERHASYPWEAMGIIARGNSNWYLEWDPASTQQTYPWLGRLEPFYDDQQAIHRLEEYYGYLGSAHKRLLRLMPQFNMIRPTRYQDQLVFPGVFEENLLLTGAYTLRSAKSIILAKDLRIPVPKQKKRPEDAQGDTTANYKPDGVFGSGGQHHIKDGPAMPGGADHPSLLRASALLDTLAYTFNHEGLVPFHYHALDWYVPEESEMTDAALTDVAPAFGTLTADQFLTPTSVNMTVDERYGTAKYYRNGSTVALHDDGTVSITAAFGEQILFCGGSIFIDAPGDVWVRTGKNFNVWAGRDANIKAHGSVDLTAAQRDLRLSANKNLQVLGGLSGKGAVLLESKAECAYHEYAPKYGEDVISGGVILRADRSQIVGITREMVLTNNCPHVENPGNLIIDFGEKKIISRCALFERHLEAGLDFFTPHGTSNEYWGTGALIGTGLAIRGPVRVDDGYLSVDGWIYAKKHIATGEAEQYSYAVGNFDAALDTTLSDEFDSIATRATDLEAYKTQAREDLTFRDGMCDAHFSFRTPTQYRTNGLVVHEARWQQMARLQGLALNDFEESTLTMHDGTQLQPFPGYEEWEIDSNYRTQELVLYNTAQGRRTDRPYENPVYSAMTPRTLKNNYITILSA